MYTIEEFERAVENSNGLVCYGIGKRFQRFVKCYSDTNIMRRLLYCIDANEEKQGKNVSVGDREIPIYSPEVLESIKNKNIILLITNLFYDKVLDDLEKKGYLKGIKYYCFTHLYGMILEEKAMQKKIPSDIKIFSEPVIPKKIHYCWFGNNPIPDQYKIWMESWKTFCPDYEIIRWDESNYNIKKNAYIYEAYQCKKWGFVSDYARLDIIYEHGGIYFDTDVELVGNFDDMLYQPAFCGFERDNYIALGLGFGAAKGNDIIREMRDFYNTIHFIDDTGQPDLTTCPVYQTSVLVQKGLKLNGEYQRVGDMVVYPEKVLSGKCPYARRIRLAPYTKSIHHYEATWTDEEFKNRNKLFELEMNSI